MISQATVLTACRVSQRPMAAGISPSLWSSSTGFPAATDMLASYEVDLDEAGDIVSYQRGKRYTRDQMGDEA